MKNCRRITMSRLMKLCQIFIIAFILLTSTSVTDAGRIYRLQRSVESSTSSTTDLSTGMTTNESQADCQDNTPCGWAVYTPFSRKVDYFMTNTCKCPKESLCIKTDDDLSVSAYVYRCHQYEGHK